MVLMVSAVSFYSCKKTPLPEPVQNPLLDTPAGFPQMDWPADNAFTQERWELGKRLFFDPILSIDSSVSCASCHKPDFAFATLDATNAGAFNRPGTRNAPSLANVGYFPYYLREGSVPTLEMQILVPIQEENEFAHNIVHIADTLAQLPEYVALSQAAYDRQPDAFVITRALATFERTLVSGNSPYDQFLNGEQGAISASAKRGLDLFMSTRTNCTACHSGFLFTDHAFENNGLYETYTDVGRERFTFDPADNGRFKVPSLRNVALTPPYMHDGSLPSLEAVIEHYNSGGKAHPNKSDALKPLQLTAAEKADLLAFLETLSDGTFVGNPIFRKK